MQKLPHNIEVEQNLLGTLLNDNKKFNKIVDTLKPDYFYLPLHAEIYKNTNNFYQRRIYS